MRREMAAVLLVFQFLPCCSCHSNKGSDTEGDFPVSNGGTGGLSVATLNLAMQQNSRIILRDLDRAPSVRDAGVLLFQEAVHSSSSPQGVPGEVARALRRYVAFAPEAPGVFDRGLAILSRYPIRDARVRALRAFNMRFHNRSRFSLSATVDSPSGPVHVWNVHLDTRINPEDRAGQLSAVLTEAASLSGPKVIAGDFNTNDFYWAANVLPLPASGRQAAAVARLMLAHGFRAPLQDGTATFNRFGMHLDWIYEQGLTARSSSVYPIGFSDHRAVVVRFTPAAP